MQTAQVQFDFSQPITQDMWMYDAAPPPLDIEKWPTAYSEEEAGIPESWTQTRPGAVRTVSLPLYGALLYKLAHVKAPAVGTVRNLVMGRVALPTLMHIKTTLMQCAGFVFTRTPYHSARRTIMVVFVQPGGGRYRKGNAGDEVVKAACSCTSTAVSSLV